MSLVGIELIDGWKVTAALPKGTTGGNFSQSYLVRNGNGDVAFMKALDFMRALQTSDPARLLHQLTQEFLFEQDILKECNSRKLRRIVRQINHGVLNIAIGGMPAVIQYIILEQANTDLRACLISLSDSVKARALQQVAVGLNQLHSIAVAHQDVKPSNVLLFPQDGAKVADLGCASKMGVTRHRDTYQIAGDPHYAPLELLYGRVSADWTHRRLGCDAYTLGSLAFLLWTKVGITASVVSRLPSHLRPNIWTGTFQDVLPALETVFEDALQDFEQRLGSGALAALPGIVRDLCHPDPARRTIFKTSQGLPMMRVVSRLNVVAQACELAERRVQ